MFRLVVEMGMGNNKNRVERCIRLKYLVSFNFTAL